MNAHIVFGLFALYVAVASLLLVLAGQQDALLALLRRLWGRTIGHTLYFIARVGLPMLVCVLCLGWGVRQYDASVVSDSFHTPLRLNVEYYRELGLMSKSETVHDLADVINGA